MRQNDESLQPSQPQIMNDIENAIDHIHVLWYTSCKLHVSLCPVGRELWGSRPVTSLAMGDALASSSIGIMLLGPETSLAAKCRAVRPWHTPDRQHPGPKQTLPPWWAHGNSVRSKDSGRFCQWHPRTRDSAGAAEHSFRHPWGRHSVVRSGLGDKRSCKLNQTSWCLFARAQNETTSGFIWLDYALLISLLQRMIF